MKLLRANRECDPPGGREMPWFSRRPCGGSSSYRCPKYSARRDLPTCSNMPTLEMADGLAVALLGVPASAQPGLLGRGREQARTQRADRDERARGHEPLRRPDPDFGLRDSDLEDGGEVAIEVDLSRDIRASESELTRCREEPLQRLRGPEPHRRRRVRRSHPGAVPELHADGQRDAGEPAD